MTKILVLGGAGALGRSVARILAGSDSVSELVIADRSLDIVSRFAETLGGKATGVQVDALDEQQLGSALVDCDLLVNVAGPEFVVVLPALRAAIRTGTNYCDIAADGPTAEKAFQMDADAKNAGVTAITGIGYVPGISNLMMVHAANQLDEVDEVQFCCYFPVAASKWLDPKRIHDEIQKSGHVESALQMVMKWGSRVVRSFEDGKWVDLDALTSGREVTLPQGATVTAHPSCCTEPITIPRFLGGVRTVRSLICLFPPQFDRLYRQMGSRLDSGEVDAAGAAQGFIEAATKESDVWPTSEPPYPRERTAWVTASGRKGDRRARYVCWPRGEWASAVGPLAAASLKMLRGEIAKGGILAPEMCLMPLPFLEEAARCVGRSPSDRRVLEERLEWA